MDTLAQFIPSTVASTSGATAGLTNFTADPLRGLVQGIDRLDIFNHPDQLLNTLSTLHVIWGVIFVILGMLSLFNGYQWHRWIVMIISFIVGVEIGRLLNTSTEVTVIIAVCVGILTSVIAWPLMRYAISLCGALAGALVAANVWTAIGLPAETHFAGAVTGFVMFGMLSFLAYRVVIVAMTCVAGSFIFMMGGLSLLTHMGNWESGLRPSLVENPVVIPLIALVVAVIGFVVQSGALLPSGDGAKGSRGARPAPA